jgi:large subunit ribosomal protein L30
MAEDKAKTDNKIQVTQIKSLIGCKPIQRKTLTGLGLRKIRHSRLLENTASVRGMIEKVQHLVSVKTL